MDNQPIQHRTHSTIILKLKGFEMKYTNIKIADELIKTALNESYYGNALYVAMDFPCLTESDKRCLHRYLHGSQLNLDHVQLQEIANKIMEYKI
jgi:hypothetical protein